MLWGKKEQVILWVTAYLPLFLIMIYRFIDSNDYFKKTALAKWLAGHIDKVLFDTIMVFIIMGISLFAYRSVTNWLFEGREEELTEKGAGKTIFVRKYEKLGVNDYSFFLITLLVPLVSIDHSSVINLLVTFLIITVVITIYVKSDFISTCPLFFTSGRRVFRAIISSSSKTEELENPQFRIDAIIITKEENLDLNNNFRAERLIGNIYYLAKRNSY